jgi:hypothetical protein
MGLGVDRLLGLNINASRTGSDNGFEHIVGMKVAGMARSSNTECIRLVIYSERNDPNQKDNNFDLERL